MIRSVGFSLGYSMGATVDSTADNAITETPEDCVAQLQAHLDVGVQKIIFVPYKYQAEQIEAIARDIIPRLKAR